MVTASIYMRKSAISDEVCKCYPCIPNQSRWSSVTFRTRVFDASRHHYRTVEGGV